MKLALTIWALLCCTMALSQQEASIVHEGRYLGKNLYVQNPYTGNGIDFCVTRVTVNDTITIGKINAGAFEIDLSNIGLKLQDRVVVKIIHKTDCLPKILNPEPIHRKCTFQTSKIEIIKDSLHWYTRNEESPMLFIIEQYRWNKWIQVGTIEGLGPNEDDNHYSYPVKLHQGINKFRVKQNDFSGKPCLSPNTTKTSNSPKITYNFKKRAIVFSSETLFELYDTPGNLVKRGHDSIVDISDLHKGLYYLNYDNTTGDVINLKK